VSSNFVGPYLMGWLRDATGSFRSGMFVIAGFMVMAGVLALILREIAGAAPTDHAGQAALVTTASTTVSSTEES
jgi:MFS-type transporter involved in bile tolerance (Atg22 family)